MKPLRILVTRPEPQGEILCARIAAAGDVPLYLPTLVIQAVSAPSDIKMNQQDWLIFTSVPAVIHALPLLSTLPKEIKIAAIGAATARALREAGLTAHVQPEHDWTSEGLLALPELRNLKGQRVTLIRGVGGRTYLAEQLLARGAILMQAIVYERVLPKIDMRSYQQALQSHQIDIIICTSGESLKNLFVLFGAGYDSLLTQTPILVASERLKTEAIQKGFTKIFVAANASNDALLAALLQIPHRNSINHPRYR